jgi:diaminopimelate decarboxylase
MNHFEYKAGALHAEDVPLTAIAEAVGTPFYCYSTATLVRHYRVFTEALEGLDTLICYSVKANSNLAVIRTLAELGAGADVVSGGELLRALAAGIPPERIVFSGVGKTEEELALALDRQIHQVNVESVPELESMSALAVARKATMAVAVRVNPDVDAETHDKIATGRSEDKFGVDIEDALAVFARAAELPGVTPVSVAVHIGSQLTDLGPFRAAFQRVAELVGALRDAGHDIRRLDLGGGLGIPYHGEAPPSPAEYAAMARETLGDLGCTLMFEPGRMLVGNAGVLVSRVIYMKEGRTRRFAVIDAAMNDLIRPTLYDAYHGVIPVRQAGENAPLEAVDIVGPVCETGDTFAQNRSMPPLVTGDLLAFTSAGAYGAVMASSYNSRLLVPEVLVNGKAFSVVRARPSYDDLLALDSLADWQDEAAIRRRRA